MKEIEPRNTQPPRFLSQALGALFRRCGENKSARHINISVYVFLLARDLLVKALFRTARIYFAILSAEREQLARDVKRAATREPSGDSLWPATNELPLLTKGSCSLKRPQLKSFIYFIQ